MYEIRHSQILGSAQLNGIVEKKGSSCLLIMFFLVDGGYFSFQQKHHFFPLSSFSLQLLTLLPLAALFNLCE